MSFVLAVAPVMVTVHVATVDIDPGLLLVNDLTLRQAGKGQGVEAHGALRPGSVQLLPQGLQLFKGGDMTQSSRCPPKQGGPTQINQRTILKGV